MKLKTYQIELSNIGADILQKYNIVYYAIEMRVGKTLIALETAKKVNANKVLFVTKKKAIPSILKDYNSFTYNYDLVVTNYEQLHKENNLYDLIILDEAHCIGAFPKPNVRTKLLKNIIRNNKLILLSGTPTPESYSQLFHQLYVSKNSPFTEINFYQWSKKYVDVKQRKIKGYYLNDYSRAKIDLIETKTKHLFVKYTQKEAGLKNVSIDEKVIFIDIDKKIYQLTDLLLRHKYYKFKDGSEIICDTAVKLQNKLHQIFSGTVITETNTKILDLSKAEYIFNNYKEKKIAVFYQFVAEGEALKQIFKNYTNVAEEFQVSQDKIFISQYQSNSMGVDLSSADIIIYYNINFSFVQYWQSRARQLNISRDKKAEVHWLFSKFGIEQKIYQVVQEKKNYTNYYFKKDYGNKITK